MTPAIHYEAFTLVSNAYLHLIIMGTSLHWVIAFTGGTWVSCERGEPSSSTLREVGGSMLQTGSN